jgi:hypothetical protein
LIHDRDHECMIRFLFEYFKVRINKKFVKFVLPSLNFNLHTGFFAKNLTCKSPGGLPKEQTVYFIFLGFSRENPYRVFSFSRVFEKNPSTYATWFRTKFFEGKACLL